VRRLTTIVKANEGISVVEVDNGSFATYTALNLAALKVWNGALNQLILDFLGVLDADTRISSLGSDSDPTNAAATVIHTTSVGGRLNTDAFLEPVGLRIGGVDVSRVQPGIPDPVQSERIGKSHRSDLQSYGRSR
jgi:hypothetical protein